MKKIPALIVCFLAVISLCACTPPQSNQPTTSAENISDTVPSTQPETEPPSASTADTETITVDGVVYRNKFQGDFVLRNPQYGNEALLSDDSGRYFRLKNTEHDLIYNVYTRNIGAPEGVFCRDDMWQTLHAYYSDINNCTFHCIVNVRGGEFKSIEVAELDVEKLNELSDFCEENSYNPMSFFDIKPTKTVSTSALGNTEYRFVMNTKDGLFSFGAASFFVLDERLVLEYYELVSKGETKVVEVPEELSNYFMSVINSLK